MFWLTWSSITQNCSTIKADDLLTYLFSFISCTCLWFSCSQLAVPQQSRTIRTSSLNTMISPSSMGNLRTTPSSRWSINSWLILVQSAPLLVEATMDTWDWFWLLSNMRFLHQQARLLSNQYTRAHLSSHRINYPMWHNKHILIIWNRSASTMNVTTSERPIIWYLTV